MKRGVGMKKGITAAGCLGVLLAGARLLSAADPDPAKGKDLFDQCSVCHNSDSDERKMGPGLKGLFKKGKLSNGKPANEANVRAVINEGGNGMPAFADLLSDQDRDNLIAYLKTL
jgi:mono/diheme cytochrome c family protein